MKLTLQTQTGHREVAAFDLFVNADGVPEFANGADHAIGSILGWDGAAECLIAWIYEGDMYQENDAQFDIDADCPVFSYQLTIDGRVPTKAEFHNYIYEATV